jgi:thermitase
LIIQTADQGAKVTNHSWGGGRPIQMARDAVNYSASLDIVQVAAAGNYNSKKRFYPAAFEEIVSVASTDVNDKRSIFSNYGLWIDLAAPGSKILNTWTKGATKSINGTSMASPHVAGAAAFIRSLNIKLNKSDAAKILKVTADDLGAKGFDNQFGWGRINLFNAAKMAQLYK